MDNMEESGVFDVNVSTLTHLEQSKTTRLTINQSGMITLILRHDLIVSVSFMYYPRDYLRQTSADVISLEQCPIHRHQSSIPAAVQHNFSLLTNKQNWTNILHISGLCETPASCRYMQQDSP